MKKMILMVTAILMASCAQLGTQKEMAKVDTTAEVKVVKDLNYYTKSIDQAQSKDQVELLLEELMTSKNLSIEEKTNLVSQLKNKVDKLALKLNYIHNKLKVDAILKVEVQNKIGEITGKVENLGNKVITQVVLEITNKDKSMIQTFGNQFPMLLKLNAEDNNLKVFKINKSISNIPEDWNKSLSIKVLDVHFL